MELIFYHIPLMIKCMSNQEVKDYLSKIGRVGGKKSKRVLSPQTARDMVRLREARRAFKLYYFQCFWSYRPDIKIELEDIPWVADQLKKHGNRKMWQKGVSLCP